MKQKIFSKLFGLFVICLLLLTIGLIAKQANAQAAPGVTAITLQPQAETPVDFDGLLAKLPTMSGFVILFAFLISTGKKFGVVKDGQAPAWNAGLNLLLLAVMLAVGYLKLPIPLDQVDQIAGTIAQAGTFLLLLISQIAGTKGTYLAVKGMPVIGTSNSATTIKIESVALDTRLNGLM